MSEENKIAAEVQVLLGEARRLNEQMETLALMAKALLKKNAKLRRAAQRSSAMRRSAGG